MEQAEKPIPATITNTAEQNLVIQEYNISISRKIQQKQNVVSSRKSNKNSKTVIKKTNIFRTALTVTTRLTEWVLSLTAVEDRLRLGIKNQASLFFLLSPFTTLLQSSEDRLRLGKAKFENFVFICLCSRLLLLCCKAAKIGFGSA
ncbi:MAG: hypothetical protein IAC54_05825 [Bacteroidetes bacterium]|uniref:Uncharacterized protein n=1 Tax=Candidatus Caccoplasma merdipullorum TaxID=2840718 RepID=A0A9D9E468_9BACT|nr:hypothetical protein [Candidatus Caccoplasma merdipullorum]